MITRIVQITGEEQVYIDNYNPDLYGENITIPDGFTTYYTDKVEVL